MENEMRSKAEIIEMLYIKNRVLKNNALSKKMSEPINIQIKVLNWVLKNENNVEDNSR